MGGYFCNEWNIHPIKNNIYPWIQQKQWDSINANICQKQKAVNCSNIYATFWLKDLLYYRINKAFGLTQIWKHYCSTRFMTEVANRIITTFRANNNFVNIIKPDSAIIKPTKLFEKFQKV